MIRRLVAYRELIGVAIIALVAAPLLSAANPLARPDLVPFTTAVLAVCAALRGARLGPGPHPMLAERPTRLTASLLGRIGLAGVPLALWFAFDAGAEAVAAWVAAVVAAVTAAALALWQHDRRSPWNPLGPSTTLTWAFGGFAVLVVAAGLGRLAMVLPELFPLAPRAALLGLQFLAIGLCAGHPRNLRQRRAAGRSDRGRVQPFAFGQVLALVGPSAASLGHGVCFAMLFGRVPDMAEAYVICLLVPVWAAVLWPNPTPHWVACVWHEVLPSSGMEGVPNDVALGFDLPPVGALRFNPLTLVRTRTLHPWFVAVQQARVGKHDDPAVPLWEPGSGFPAHHVLGDAVFAAVNGRVQTEEITLRMATRPELVSISQSDAQTRRLVVLRAFPHDRSRSEATYRWQRAVPKLAVQVLDAACPLATLRDGDVLVLSADGVARAYELEIGVAFAEPRPMLWRHPQMMDYVQVNS